MINLTLNLRKLLIGIILFSLFCPYQMSYFGEINAEKSIGNKHENFQAVQTSNWWNNSWNYCQRIDISNPGSSLLNYQILITLNPENFNYSKAAVNGTDVRFILNDNSTLLNYWIECWNTIGESIIWVKIPILEGDDIKTIFLYYGNNNATSQSSGFSVFEAFDDFTGNDLNGSIWEILEYEDGGFRSYNVNNSELHTYIYAYGLNLYSGYIFKLKQNVTQENFIITLKSRWENLDHYRGYGIFNGMRMIDDDGDNTHNTIALWGDAEVVLHQQKDEAFNYLNVADASKGKSLFEYKVLVDNYDLSISGTYENSLIFTNSNINRPLTILLSSLLDGRDESPVSVDVYFDLFHIRKYTPNELLVVLGPISKWWCNNWNYCQRIEISNPDSSLLNYQILITLNPENFNYPQAAFNGDDLRFTLYDNNTLLNYWIENWISSGKSNIWVKIPILEGFSTKTIFLYYGNDEATSQSNGASVFDVFDDFTGNDLNDSIWDIIVYDYSGFRSYEVNNGELHTYINAFGFGLNSGYMFKLRQNVTMENFVITLKSRWENFDYYRAYGIADGLRMIDAEGYYIHNALGLWGDAGVTLHQQVDTTFNYLDLADISEGNSYYEYKVRGTYCNLSLSGTYNNKLIFTDSNIPRPLTILMHTVFEGRDESPASVDVYFDLFHIRKYAANEPLVVLNPPKDENPATKTKLTINLTTQLFSIITIVTISFILLSYKISRKRKYN